MRCDDRLDTCQSTRGKRLQILWHLKQEDGQTRSTWQPNMLWTRIYVKALFSQGHCYADLAGAGHTRRKNIIHEQTNCLLILFLILDYIVLFLFFCCCNCGFRHGAERGCWKTQSLVEPSGPRAERLNSETQNTQNFHHFFNSARWTTIQNQQRFFSFIARLLNYWLVGVFFFLFFTRRNVAAPLAARRETRASRFLLADMNETHIWLCALSAPLACVPGITAAPDYRSMDGPAWYFWFRIWKVNPVLVLFLSPAIRPSTSF